MEYTYIDRLKQIKSEKKITNDQLSELTGIPLGTLSKILAGISDSPKLSNIVAICAALECSVDYILTGIPENTNNYTLDDDEIEMVENYRKLDPHSKELVAMVVEKEAERVTSADTRLGGKVLSAPSSVRGSAMKNAVGLSRRSISLYDLPVSAGTGVFLTDTESVDIKIPDTPGTASADFALRIKGNSMEPKYRDGDVLLIEECDAVEYGELGIFILDGDGYFKKFGGDRLISLNPEYSDILLKNFDDVSCCGRVVGKLKRK
jgi:phage repressor protein C with HTH and peptisase S24 domain/DNA-binding Xre family transcriptional regulator